jgi:hypothetical protein
MDIYSYSIYRWKKQFGRQLAWKQKNKSRFFAEAFKSDVGVRIVSCGRFHKNYYSSGYKYNSY